ncbi:MAG: imidazole glycerol phosphate synthase subunit HisH [Magnetococcales bacterium]|nr:imidazole glycerol phosphate synthase subunit HisH [Magnetococcales bacterium]MBF0156346.1 imidazole glycerol phosphate synthase subunit HisH [Magnetococcales bacterium]
MTPVTVIDYGVGNLLSVGRALSHCGAEVVFCSDPEGVVKAERLILPGVGAFAKGMAELDKRGLIPALREVAERGVPLLGICLGMQLLLETSDEFGTHTGLGLIPGRVVAIPPQGIDGSRHAIPHIGWNNLLLPGHRQGWKGSILERLPHGESVYFVHSFTAVPADPLHRLADCHYNGLVISAAIARDNLSGCQFHPEKSGERGLDILRAFLAL